MSGRGLRLEGKRGVECAPSCLHPLGWKRGREESEVACHLSDLPPRVRAHSMAENREPRGAVEAELDPVEYTLRKRLPHRLPRRPNDIYVNMKTDFKAQLARCQKLLDGGARGQNSCSEIYIHGLGLAINRAINIALQLQAGSFGSLQVAANTSTVELVDELEPETDTREPLTRIRNNSAIHIRVFRVTPK